MNQFHYSTCIATILMIASALVSLDAQANEQISIKNGICTLSDAITLLESSRFKGEAICEGMGNPSIELNHCMEKHGNGNFENGVAVVTKRNKYNRWTSAMKLAMNPDMQKEPLVCNDLINAVNAWSNQKEKKLIYEDRDVARKFIIVNGNLKLK